MLWFDWIAFLTDDEAGIGAEASAVLENLNKL